MAFRFPDFPRDLGRICCVALTYRKWNRAHEALSACLYNTAWSRYFPWHLVGDGLENSANLSNSCELAASTEFTRLPEGPPRKRTSRSGCSPVGGRTVVVLQELSAGASIHLVHSGSYQNGLGSSLGLWGDPSGPSCARPPPHPTSQQEMHTHRGRRHVRRLQPGTSKCG